MHARTFSPIQRRRQGGYTLMEILVAVAIFATVMIVALLLYDQSNRVFKQANESAEMQQNTRVAYEKVVADLRMAGFDYKRAGTPTAGFPNVWVKDTDYGVGTLVIPKPANGHVYRVITAGKSGANPPGWLLGTGATFMDGTVQWQEAGAPVYEQPDEQIEFAHDKAITIRANFDYEDPGTVDKGREPDLEKASDYHFPVVTTGNDEIVTYALVSRSTDPLANKDTISFFADVNPEGSAPSRTAYPGGDAEREIKITGVDLTNKYPPYTLMRYTLNDEGKVVGTALADNIRSLEFTYWQDASGRTKLTDFDNKDITDFNTLGGLGKFDPDSAVPVKERLVREKIRAVTATIVGMNPQPDYNYKHPSDTVAQNYRQYTLQSTIVGRNLGLQGVPQSDTKPPDPPVLSNACTGYCGVALLNWQPAPGSSDYVTYTVLYDTAKNGSYSGVLPAGTQTSYAVDLTQFDLEKTYYFRVAATNGAGTTLSEGDPLQVSLKNSTKPEAPTITGASTGKANEIEVMFIAPTKNVGTNPSCSPSGSVGTFVFAPAEIKGYRIYRSRDSNFTPGDSSSELVVDENGNGLAGDSTLTSNGAGTITLVDSNVANCDPMYYRVAAVEWCHAKGTYNTNGDVNTAISDYSAAIQGQAVSVIPPKPPTQLKQHVTSVCDSVNNRCDPVTLLWDKVTHDVNDNEIVIRKYNIYRDRKLSGLPDEASKLVGSVSDGTTTWTDDQEKLLEHVPGNDAQKYTYLYTVKAEQLCPVPTGTEGVGATLLYPGTCVTGATVKPDGDGPGSGTPDDPMESVTALTVVEYPTKPIKSVEVSVDGSGYSNLPYPYTFEWDVQDGEVHRIGFRVKTDDCTEILPFYIQSDAADCAFRGIAYNVLANNSKVRLELTNVSTETITLEDFDITWAGQTGFTWVDITLPSGAAPPATTQGSQTTASPRTVTFTPAGADKIVDPAETYVIILNFSGIGVARPATLTAMSLDYFQGNDETKFGCAPQIVTCAVAATVTTNYAAETATIAVKNNSNETVIVSELSIAWAGQNNWTWENINAGGETFSFTPIASGTKVVQPAVFQIAAGATSNIVLQLDKKTGSTPPLLPATFGDVILEYTTETSGPTSALTCRAK